MNTMKSIDARVIRMLTRQGFIDLFWEELQSARKENPCVSREQVFESMNQAYFSAIGMYRYIDYDSFKCALKRK